jgi:predicted Zn-dependent protease
MPASQAFLRRSGALLLAAWALALGSCQTGHRYPGAPSLEPTAAEISHASDEILSRYGGAYRNPALQAYVEQVGGRIIAATPLPAGSVTFVLIDTDAVNAYAVPGATVFLTRGLFTWLNSEAELAGVIAHELAHVTERHVAEARLAERAAAQRAQAQGVLRLDEDAEARLLAYSRTQELEADRVGLGYLVAAGYPGRAMADNLRQFDAVEQMSRLERGVGDGIYPGEDAMTTHPSSAERTAALAALPPFAADGDAMHARYLAAVAGLPFGPRADDWRVAGHRMVHPTAGIEFSLPTGYVMASSAGVLSGTGPERSALVIDFVARDPSTTPAAYLNRAFGRIGVNPAETQMIGGFPAAVIGLEEEGDGQRWRAVLGTIGVQDDALLRVVSLAPASGAAVEEAAFRAVVDSLRHSASAAAAPTHRLVVHEVATGESIASLTQKMNPPAPTEGYAEDLLRALNGLAPGDEVAPGDMVKLVE